MKFSTYILEFNKFHFAQIIRRLDGSIVRAFWNFALINSNEIVEYGYAKIPREQAKGVSISRQALFAGEHTGMFHLDIVCLSMP